MAAVKKAVSFAAAKEDNGTSGGGGRDEFRDTAVPVDDDDDEASAPSPRQSSSSSRKPYDRWTSVPAGVIRSRSPLEDPQGEGDDVEGVARRSELFQCPVYVVKLKNFFERVIHVIMSEGGLVIILVIYSVIGAAAFVAIEGKAEDERIAAASEGEDRSGTEESNSTVRRDFLDAILNLTGRGGEDSDRNVSDTLEEFLSRFEINPVQMPAGDQMNGTKPATMKQWNWYGALIFCGTVYTTVGYGHIVPSTNTGRIVTMVYALIGIPLCLVVLSKLGKTLTKLIKFLWSFVRRFYYTGSCFRVRKKTGWRKLTLGERIRLRLTRRVTGLSRTMINQLFVPYDIDDNFNLPPIVALIIAFVYIFSGALMYTLWENWSFLEAFYFTFTSLATIGFGDILPSHPKFFVAAGAYILVGLSLIAMVINVIMEAVSETITKATDQVIMVGNKVKEVKERIINITPVGRLMRSSTPPPRETTKSTERRESAAEKQQEAKRRHSL